jgi:rhamnose transport system ATP-binding protein
LGRHGEYHDLDVKARPGEIVGLYGLVGFGVPEIAASICGIDRVGSVSILIDGTEVRPRSPRRTQRLE